MRGCKKNQKNVSEDQLNQDLWDWWPDMIFFNSPQVVQSKIRIERCFQGQSPIIQFSCDGTLSCCLISGILLDNYWPQITVLSSQIWIIYNWGTLTYSLFLSATDVVRSLFEDSDLSLALSFAQSLYFACIILYTFIQSI